jgi:hypothetical protein
LKNGKEKTTGSNVPQQRLQRIKPEKKEIASQQKSHQF